MSGAPVGTGTSLTIVWFTVFSDWFANDFSAAPAAMSGRTIAIFVAPCLARASGSVPKVTTAPPVIGYAAGEVKSAAPAGLRPIDAILFCAIVGMNCPEYTDRLPTMATTPSLTAFWPQPAAVFGSLAVSHTSTSTGRAGLPRPPALLIAFAAAVAPSAVSVLPMPAVFSNTTMSLIGGPVGFAAAPAPEALTASPAAASAQATAIDPARIHLARTACARMGRPPRRRLRRDYRRDGRSIRQVETSPPGRRLAMVY